MTTAGDCGFVLKTWPLREADVLVSLFTREHGKLRGVAHSARRPKSRWSGCLDALTEIEVVWREREGQELLSFREGAIVRSPYLPMPGLPVIWTLAYVAELIDETAPPNDPEETLYRLVAAASEALRGGTDPQLVARYVEAWILRLQGVLPDVAACVACGARASAEGLCWVLALHGLACVACARSHFDGAGPPLLPEDVAFLDQVRRRSPAEIATPGPRSLRRTRAFLRGLVHELLGRRLRSEALLDSLDEELPRAAGEPPGD